MKLGFQLYSVRDDMAADFLGTLKKVKAMGFEGGEMAGWHGYTAKEVKAMFDYSAHTIEYVNRTLQADPPICSALFLLNNDYAVVIVMSIADASKEITDNFEEGY